MTKDPICGMTVEPKTVTAGTDDEENTKLLDMTRRFWIGAALTVPVFVLAMAHMIPAPAVQSLADSHTSRWLKFAPTAPAAARAAPSKHCSTSHRPWRDMS